MAQRCGQQLLGWHTGAVLVAALLVAAQFGLAKAQSSGTSLNWMDNVNPANPFPAGLNTMPTNPYTVTHYEQPTLPANAYRGIYGYTTCLTDQLIAPTSTQELSQAIQDMRAKAAAQGRPLKMRATRQGFGTIQSFPCPGQHTSTTPFGPLTSSPGSQAPLVVGIMMDKMDKVLAVDQANNRLRVQAQMTVRQLLKAAQANHMSTPRSALPWWQGLTLGGVFSTASHGTGLNQTSTLCDWFVDVTWVDAAGAVHVSRKGSEEAKALCGGIGLLGTLTEFTLQLTAPTNTWFSTWWVKDDFNLAADVEEMLKVTPHIVVMWRPDIGKYTSHLQRPAPPGATVTTLGAQCNVIPQVSSFAGYLTGPMFQAWQSDPFNKGSLYYTAGGDASLCLLGQSLALGAPWVTTPGPGGVPIPVYEGVAPTTQVTSTNCHDECSFIAPSLMATGVDVEFAFEKSRLAEFISDIRSLIKKDLQGIPGWFAHTRCLPPGYYVMRFGRAPKSLLGHAAGLKEPVYVQQQMLASRATPGVPSRYEWVFETYEQLMLCKYNAKPHTGKNWDRTFTHPRCPVAAKYGDRLKKMEVMRAKFDPDNVYEPELYRRVASGQSCELKPRCQLDRSCYCVTDEHCADGFACQPSIAFPEYTACRPKAMN